VGDAPVAGSGSTPTAGDATTVAAAAADGGGGDAYYPLGGGGAVAWRLVAGGGGFAILNVMERMLGVGEAAGRGLRLDLVGREGRGATVARCVVAYTTRTP